METKYSVLMSLYHKEKADNLRECFESLIKQTILASEWLIVKDGPLTDELENVLNEYDKLYPNLIKYVVLNKNQGLGLALRAGLQECSFELVARMDTDDICVSTRMERQLNEFHKNKALTICGSYIKEFDKTIDNVISIRKVPLSNLEIRKYQKRRSSFNHMTVMFKKSFVLSSGNYEHTPLMEDDMLWVRMLINNCVCMNIDDYLVYARTGLLMIGRRGGYNYFKKYRAARMKIYKTGFISRWDLYYTLIVQFVVCLLPPYFRILFFKKMLRTGVGEI